MAELLTVYHASLAEHNIQESILSPTEIDILVECLQGNIQYDSPTSFVISAPPNQNNVMVIGAWFIRKNGGGSLTNLNLNSSLNRNISAAASFEAASLMNVTYLKILLIGYPKYDCILINRTTCQIISPVIVASLNYSTDKAERMNISLYFMSTTDVASVSSDDLSCAYYDAENNRWDSTNCTKPMYSSTFGRYECKCHHLSSFALIFSPSSGLSSALSAEDIASLTFQSISIVCFLVVIIHSTVSHIILSNETVEAVNLLPMISTGSTVLLFVFYIALVLTVNTKTQSSKEEKCFTSSVVLMYFVYFLLIFMFCAKTSIGYFNHIRFIRLFPPPSLKRLVVLLLISFIISISAATFVAGFNSNSSLNILILYAFRICWFNKNVIYYFLTIPIGIFLLINVWILIRVGVRIVNHARHHTAPHRSFSSMKRCILILSFSSISQGIGWIIGPILSISFNDTFSHILAWLFIILNGLEGLWSVLLYIIIRKNGIDESKRKTEAVKLLKTKQLLIKTHKDTNTARKQTKSQSKEVKCQLIFRRPTRQIVRLDHLPYITAFDHSTDKYYA